MAVNLKSHITPPATVAVAMSGGVDSSLAAVILKMKGYQVVGLSMRLWDAADDDQSRCCSRQALADAQAVCRQWDIPHYVLDLRRPFERQVIQPFVREYLSGRTPNPCVVCNTEMKWTALLAKATALGAVALSTGHYAQVVGDETRGRFLLLRGRDRQKDQSYALWGLSQEALSRTILPLGSLSKTQTRRLAGQLKLPVAGKRDSQEICFVPNDDYGTFIESRWSRSQEAAPWCPGPMVDRRGNVLGHHRGIPFYTIGQRRGLGLSAGRPLYVLDIDPMGNRLVVGTSDELLTRSLWAHRCNWVSISPPLEPMTCWAQIRYRHRAAPATLFPLETGGIQVIFRRPQRAITPGQSVVLYRRDELLGGGLIRRPSMEELSQPSPAALSGTRAGRR